MAFELIQGGIDRYSPDTLDIMIGAYDDAGYSGTHMRTEYTQVSFETRSLLMRDAIGTVTWFGSKFTGAESAIKIIAFIVIDDINVLTAQG